LQSTALVNEAYMKLVGQHHVRWQNRAHFFGIAAQLIRRILVDYARTRLADKRGADAPRLSLEDVPEVAARGLDLIALNDALDDLAKIDARQSRVVELRFFAGLSVEETAEVLQMSPATVKREWTAAKAWLFRQIRRQGANVS
jgi:RNA polymerase sigma factor (TIGR02999 family)